MRVIEERLTSLRTGRIYYLLDSLTEDRRHQQTWDRFYAVARHATVWIAHGRLECKDQVIHVVVHSLEDLTDRLRGLRSNSRDFR